jgi:hypothetical protein
MTHRTRPTIREAQEAALLLGPARVDTVCGPGGLSGATAGQLRKLVAEAAYRAAVARGAAWMASRQPAPAPPPAPSAPAAPAPSAADFDAAFARLDRGHGVVHLAELRRALACGRTAFDALLLALRLAGRYSAIGAEGRGGLSRADREAGVREGERLLVFITRRA